MTAPITPPITPPPAPVAACSSVFGCALLVYAMASPAPAPVMAPSTPPTAPHAPHFRGGGACVEHPEIAVTIPIASAVARARYRIDLDRGSRGVMKSLSPADEFRSREFIAIAKDKGRKHVSFRPLTTMRVEIRSSRANFIPPRFRSEGSLVNARL